MSAVGIVYIGMGLLALCARGPLLVAPAATLRWLSGVIETDSSIRILGVIAVVFGAAMIGAGATEHSTLATILTIWGWFTVVVCIWALILFPDAYRKLVVVFLPAEAEERLPGWRLLGALGVIFGLFLIYFGVLAL